MIHLMLNLFQLINYFFNILQKLDAIEKLKEQQAQGKTLEVNQMAKIKTESELLNELQQLQI